MHSTPTKPDWLKEFDMILDSRLIFADNFDLGQETGTYLFTNQIDLQVIRDIGQGQPLYLFAVVTEAFTDGGDSATLNLRLRSDADASVHATTSTGHFESGTMLKAALTLGAKFMWAVPMEGNVYEPVLGLQGVVGTAGFDAGMITAGLTFDPHGWKSYPDAI